MELTTTTADQAYKSFPIASIFDLRHVLLVPFVSSTNKLLPSYAKLVVLLTVSFNEVRLLA